MKNKDKLFFGIVIFCILLVVAMLIFMKSEQNQCLKNPYIYGASKMGEVECSCRQGVGLCPAQFSFNSTTFTSERTVCGSGNNTKYKTIDLNSLNLTLSIVD